MASATRIVKLRRKMKKASQGRKRKAYLRAHGSTQLDLPLTVPNANEKAQIQARTLH